MRRSVKKPQQIQPNKKNEKVRRAVKQQSDRPAPHAEIEDFLLACSKGDRDSIIYVGNLVENTLKGPFGAVIKALTAGRIDMELQANRDGKLSADRVLGRCEMASGLWHDLEMFVLEKDQATKPIKRPRTDEIDMAEDPQPERETSLA